MPTLPLNQLFEEIIWSSTNNSTLTVAARLPPGKVPYDWRGSRGIRHRACCTPALGDLRSAWKRTVRKLINNALNTKEFMDTSWKLRCSVTRFEKTALQIFIRFAILLIMNVFVVALRSGESVVCFLSSIFRVHIAGDKYTTAYNGSTSSRAVQKTGPQIKTGKPRDLPRPFNFRFCCLQSSKTS